MRHMLRPLLISLCLVVLACVPPTALDHYQSQSRLDDGLERLKEAREEAMKPANSKNEQAILSSDNSPSRLQVARAELANDARTDYARAINIVRAEQPEDKISYLFRAGVKSWHAGAEADTDLVQKIYSAGVSACKGEKSQLAPRDCQIISAIRILTAMQREIDAIFDLGLEKAAEERRGGPQLTPVEMLRMIHAVRILSEQSSALGEEITNNTLTDDGTRADLARFMREFQLNSWCQAVAAMNLVVSARDADNAKIGRKASDIMNGYETEGSPALVSALSGGNLTVGGIYKLYREYSDSIFDMTKEHLGQDWEEQRGKPPLTHRWACEKMF